MDPDLATLNELFTTTYRSVLKVEEVMLRHLSNGSLTLSEMHMLECIGKRKGVDYQRQQMRGDGMEKGVRKAPDAQSAAAKRAGMIARMDGTDKKEGGNK